MTTNDDAREAALSTYQEEVPLQDESDAESHERGWNDAIAHLRATGQLCTAEERAVLDFCDRINGESVEWIADGPQQLDVFPGLIVRLQLARRAAQKASGT